MLPVRMILFPTDFSKQARPAFRAARAIARDYAARLIVLYVEPMAHVVESLVSYTEANALYTPPEDYRPRREALKERLVTLYDSPELSTEYRVEEGDAAEEVLRVAEEAKVDLIVIGTHGRTGLGRLLMGSVAEAVLRGSFCPVLSVRSLPRVSAAESGKAGRRTVAT